MSATQYKICPDRPWKIRVDDIENEPVVASLETGDSHCDAWTKHGRLLAAAGHLYNALAEAEKFISGFEGDPIQNGIDELLDSIRSAISRAGQQTEPTDHPADTPTDDTPAVEPNKQPSFWVIWNPSGRNPRYRHEAIEGANTEANRLALANPGEEFYVLQATSRRVLPLPQPDITEFAPARRRTGHHPKDDEIPF